MFSRLKPLATRVSVVAFQCPRCNEEWHARVIGDDVEVLPRQEAALPLV